MIYGIGTDLCDVRRVRESHAQFGQRFIQRVLGPGEQAMFARRYERLPERGLRYLATRFSAKEAFSKAIGLGIHSPMRWRSCEILNLPTGQPVVVLHDDLLEWFEARRLHAHISITDEGDLAASYCIVEQSPAP